jgi:hypothetical protein
MILAMACQVSIRCYCRRIEGELVEMRLRLWLFSLAQVGLLALIAWQLYHH